MAIRRATSADLDRVASILQTAGLPSLPAGLPLANVLVAMEDSEVFGAIAVQVIGLRGLMWPVAVDPSHADDEVRSSLLRSLLARANELSLRELYVLTEKDAEFFAGAGFVPISHEATPPEIHSSRDYRDWHSESMKVMRLQLVTRFV